MPLIDLRLARLLSVMPLLALAAGCAPAGTSAVGGSWPTSEVVGGDAAQLAAWADFPIGRKPRPIILIGEVVRQAGYRSDSAKIAAMTGRFELGVALPAAPATVRVTLPDGAFSFPAITAQQAYETVRASGKPANAPDASAPPVKLTAVRLGTAAFAGDRGKLTLPAWLFDGPELLEPLAVPALPASAFWRPGEFHLSVTDPATIDGDGVTLTVMLPAADPGACPGYPIMRYTAISAESPAAVAVGLRKEVATIAPGTRVENCGGDLMLRMAPYVIELAAPLGGRIVVGPDGQPIPVTTGRR
jgi:hypothetical protein